RNVDAKLHRQVTLRGQSTSWRIVAAAHLLLEIARHLEIGGLPPFCLDIFVIFCAALFDFHAVATPYKTRLFVAPIGSTSHRRRAGDLWIFYPITPLLGKTRRGAGLCFPPPTTGKH